MNRKFALSRLPAPVRLRLSRRAGFDLQRLSHDTNGLAAVNVARPSRWGNPYRIAEFGREQAIALFSRSLEGHSARWDLAFLRGKNLACWCAPDQMCHADVLLALANA
jgi:hypothetical protein